MMLKNLFLTNPKSFQINLALLIGRISIGGLMLTHGLPKLTHLLSGEPVQFASVLGFNPEISLCLAIFSEVVCSFFILIGLGTRLATIPLIVTMLVAILHIHGADPLAVKEIALHFLLMYLVLLIMGSGKYSIDSLISR